MVRLVPVALCLRLVHKSDDSWPPRTPAGIGKLNLPGRKFVPLIMSEMLLLLLLTFQDQPVDRLIEDLGSHDLSVREAAEAALEKLGSDVRENVATHQKDSDPEVRTRIRRLLDGPLLRIPEEIRVSLQGLAGDNWDAVCKAVKILLTSDRAKLPIRLREFERNAKGPLRFRIAQLRDLLGKEKKPPLRYGILLLHKEVGVDDELAGLEIWINESKEELVLKDVEGRANCNRMDPKSDVYRGVGRCSPGDGTFRIAPGAARVEKRDLHSFGGGWGKIERGERFTVTSTYTSDRERIWAHEPDPWIGSRKSNVVEYRYRSEK